MKSEENNYHRSIPGMFSETISAWSCREFFPPTTVDKPAYHQQSQPGIGGINPVRDSYPERKPCVDSKRITFGWPVIRPESMPSAEITSYKTYRELPRWFQPEMERGARSGSARGLAWRTLDVPRNQRRVSARACGLRIKRSSKLEGELPASCRANRRGHG